MLLTGQHRPKSSGRSYPYPDLLWRHPARIPQTHPRSVPPVSGYGPTSTFRPVTQQTNPRIYARLANISVDKLTMKYFEILHCPTPSKSSCRPRQLGADIGGSGLTRTRPGPRVLCWSIWASLIKSLCGYRVDTSRVVLVSFRSTKTKTNCVSYRRRQRYYGSLQQLH